MTPSTRSDAGNEAEEVQLGIVASALPSQLCGSLSSGASLFAEGVLRFRKWLASRLVFSPGSTTLDTGQRGCSL